MLNLHHDKKIVRREPGRDGNILISDHRQDGNDEVHRLQVRSKKKKEKRKRLLVCTVEMVIRQFSIIKYFLL